MRLKKLDVDVIDELFEKAEHQQDVLVGIYRSIFRDWDVIKKIDGWPSCGKDLWYYVCEKFIQFDKVHHGDVLAGGCWMNYGFSCDKKLKPWEVDISSAKITYKSVSKAA